MPPLEPPPVTESPGRPATADALSDDWRDGVSRTLLLVTLPLVVIASVILFVLVSRPEARLLLFLTAASGTVQGAYVVFRDRPRGVSRSVIVVAMFVVFGTVGLVTLGFIAGPASAFATAVVAAALLLGRRGVFVTVTCILVVVASVAFGMLQGHVPAPASTDVLATEPRSWMRTWSITLAFFAIMGTAAARVVRLLEESVDRARREVARRERAEREALATQRAALEAQKFEVIGQLAAGVAHDFNNALTAIQGASKLAALELPADSPARPLLDVVKEASERSRALTSQLLAYSRKAPVQRGRVDVHDTLRSVLELARPLFGGAVSIATRFDAPSAVVVGDASLLFNAFLNLTVNARDAMPGGGTFTVSTAVEPRALRPDGAPATASDPDARDALVVTFHDTGQGFGPDVSARLFEPFFTTKPVGKGTGLGLAAVHGTVTSHGGRVVGSGEPGRGARFTLRLPLALPDPA